MQRIIALLSSQTVRLYHRGDVGRLHRQHYIGEVEFFQKRSVIQSAVAKRLCGRMTVFLEYMLLERAGVHAYADGDILGFAGVGDRLDAAVVAYIAGIDPYLIDPCGYGFKS